MRGLARELHGDVGLARGCHMLCPGSMASDGEGAPFFFLVVLCDFLTLLPVRWGACARLFGDVLMASHWPREGWVVVSRSG